MFLCSTVRCNILFPPMFLKMCEGCVLPSNGAVDRNGSPESFLHVIVAHCIKSIGRALGKPSPYVSLDAWPSQVFLGFLGVENAPA